MSNFEEAAPHEPALVPLLDMVFQLLMFFIMCVNFVTDQVDEDIRLPKSQVAKPMDKAEVEVLFVNVMDDGKVKVLGRERPMGIPDLGVWLNQEYERARRLSRDGQTVNTSIVLRADARAKYDDVFGVMNQCKAKNFTKLRVRAVTKATSSVES